MKISTKVMAGALCVALFGPAQAAEEAYSVEPFHTYPSFEAPHQGISYWRGKFNKTSGKIWLDRQNQTGRMEITIDTASVNFGLAMMDDKARSEEWLDVKKYPTARYVGQSMTFRAGAPVSVKGQLTLRGVTRPVQLDIAEFKCMPNPMFKREVCGADARAEFDRREFGMVQDVPGNNGKVRLQIQVEALKGDTLPAPPSGPPGAPPAGAPPK